MTASNGSPPSPPERTPAAGTPSGTTMTAQREVVVITGASAGIGRATALEFARAGARVAILARGLDGLRAAAQEIEDLGGEALPIQCDVADAVQLEDAAGQIESELGPIDVWINNAMTTVFGRVLDMSPVEYMRVTDVTYHGSVWGTMAALRRMIPRGHGTIVQVGSALAYRAIPLQSAYCGSKHAIRAFLDSLRSELIHDGHTGIHLTMVQLPGLNTPQFGWCKSYMKHKAQPVPPIYQPEVAARAIYWAAHHRRREVYVALPAIESVLGQKVAPGVLDHYLAHAAFEGQQTDEPEEPGRPNNLFHPLSGDHGVHGTFDRRARKRDPVSWWSVRLGAAGIRGLAAGLTLGATAAAAVMLARAFR